MQNKIFSSSCFYFLMLLFLACSTPQEQALEMIKNSHIVGNAPSGGEFHEFLKRDLNKYFTEKYNKAATVEFELLRDKPTQFGMSYPKYYAWVIIYSDNNKIEQGVVRLAAIDKKLFDVTHFMSSDQIKKNTNQMLQIFPPDVCDKIKGKL